MDHMFEKVEALYPKAMRTGDDYFWGASDYEPLLQSIGRVLVRWDDSSYQGSTVAIMERSGQYGVLIFGWGSCSGCDALQACESYKDIADLRRSLFDSIQWGTAEDTIAWMENHDWAGDWLGRHFPPTFVDMARQALRGEQPTDETIYVEGVEDEPYAPWHPDPDDVPNGGYGTTRQLTTEELAKLPDYDFEQSVSDDANGNQEGSMDLDDRITHELDRHNLTPDDVRWVGTSGETGFCMTWAEFVQHVPRGVDYHVIDDALVVVGDDWWIEYEDGAFYRAPRKPLQPRAFTFDLRGNVIAADS